MRSGFDFNAAAARSIPHPTIHCAFIEITAEADEAIVEQLVGNDRVHTVGTDSSKALRKYRLGGEFTNKTCYGMIGVDGCVHAGIYVKRDTHDVSAGFRALNGDVRGILNERVEPLGQDPRSLIFYSISNITEERGMGQLLVRNLHAHLTQKYEQSVIFSTLSPLRKYFDQYLTQTNIEPEKFSGFSPLAQRRVILSFLMAVQDPVQKFHMGNGASIGDIKLSADTMGHTAAMINYVYPFDREVLGAQAKMFVEREMHKLVAPALLEETGFSPAQAASGPELRVL